MPEGQDDFENHAISNLINSAYFISNTQLYGIKNDIYFSIS